MNNKFYIHDNMYIKWEYENKKYLLHIHQEQDDSDNPRDWDNVGTMACWHRNYRLGDKIGKVDPEDYWQGLVRKFVSEEEIFEALSTGKLPGMELRRNIENPKCFDIYERWAWVTALGNSEPQFTMEYEEVEKDQVAYWVMDDLTINHCQILLKPYIEWLPLFLYDHGGITISTGSFSCPWDSGQVGFIWVSKEKVFEECLGMTLEDGSHASLTEENWREIARYHLEAETEVYDQYLRGDVYWYELKELVDDEYEEGDTCGGFFGDDLYTNGIIDYAPGLYEALTSNNYEDGTATCHKYTVTRYDYD